MCLQDIAIARRSYVRVTDLAANTSVRVPANPDRLAIGVVVNNGNGATSIISNNESNATGGRSYKMASATVDVGGSAYGTIECIMTYAEFGPIVQGELWVRAAINNAFYYEVLMMPELSNAVNAEIGKLTK